MPTSRFAEFKKDFFKVVEAFGLTRTEAREQHYARNDNQSSSIGYVDVLMGNYTKMSDEKSAFHRLNKPWDNGDAYTTNANNSKWVSAQGFEEYVFRYVGSPQKGGFELVTSSLNQGTYNYKPTGQGWFSFSNTKHMWQDVAPWILWGNSKADARNWTAEDRYNETIAAAGFDLWNLSDGVAMVLYDFDPDLQRNGGGGDDLRTALRHEEFFNGRAGSDTVSYSASKWAVAADLSKGKGYDGHAKGDVYKNIENLTGSKWGDILIGDGGANDLRGEGGRDTLIGLGGRNHLYGGDENDKIYGGSQKDMIEGGEGNDTIYGDYVLVGEPHGKDEIKGGKGHDWVQAGGNDDIVDGGNGKDELYGGVGDDEIRGGKKDDFIDGEEGNDTLIADGGRDTLYGGEFEEVGEGNDTFIFEAKAGSKAYGEDGDDMFVIEKGYNHFIDGGDGYDIVDLRGLVLDRLDPTNFENIEEIWVDDVLITPVSLNLSAVKVYGRHAIHTSTGGQLFGNAPITFEEGGSITVTLSQPLPSGVSSGDLVMTNDKIEIGDPNILPYKEGVQFYGLLEKASNISSSTAFVNVSARYGERYSKFILDDEGYFDGIAELEILSASRTVSVLAQAAANSITHELHFATQSYASLDGYINGVSLSPRGPSATVGISGPVVDGVNREEETAVSVRFHSDTAPVILPAMDLTSVDFFFS